MSFHIEYVITYIAFFHWTSYCNYINIIIITTIIMVFCITRLLIMIACMLVHIHVYACMHVCMYVWMNVYVFMYVSSPWRKMWRIITKCFIYFIWCDIIILIYHQILLYIITNHQSSLLPYPFLSHWLHALSAWELHLYDHSYMLNED